MLGLLWTQKARWKVVWRAIRSNLLILVSWCTIAQHMVFPFAGSAITGPIGKECADLWPRIASAANAIVWNQDLGKFRVLCAPYLGLPDVVLYPNIYCNVLLSYLFLKGYMIIELKWKVSEMLYRVVCLGLGLHMCFHDLGFLRLFSNVSGDDFLQVTMETYRLMDQDMKTMCDPRNCLSIQMTNIHWLLFTDYCSLS